MRATSGRNRCASRRSAARRRWLCSAKQA
jgi:hypothetical protein